MAVAVDVYVTSDAAQPAPISGVVVSAFDPANSYALAGSVTTDANGLAALLLPGSMSGYEYEVRCFKLGVVFGGISRIAVVEPVVTTNSFDITAHVNTLSSATDPRVCRCTGRFMDLSNRPIVGTIVRITAKADPGTQVPKVIDGNMISAESTTLTTDQNGYVVVDLPRGGEYYVTFSGELDSVWNLVVPDRASANLVELIHPQPVAVVWDAETAPNDAISVPVEYALDVPFTLLFSNYEARASGFSSWISISTSDESVATARLTDGSVVVTGIAAGTATVTVEPKATLYPARIPTPTIQSNTLTVTVTT